MGYGLNVSITRKFGLNTSQVVYGVEIDSIVRNSYFSLFGFRGWGVGAGDLVASYPSPYR